jgi:preprotein translocase subunit Sec63
MTTTRRLLHVTVLQLVLFITILLSSHAAADTTTTTSTADLYKLLGVPKTATTQEIKQAYRRKALDTHPDKNKNIPADQAAAAFHAVVQAFEVLSDPTSRQR